MSRYHTVALDCGCRPLFAVPVPSVGEWITCLFHERGAVVVGAGGFRIHRKKAADG